MKKRIVSIILLGCTLLTACTQSGSDVSTSGIEDSAVESSTESSENNEVQPESNVTDASTGSANTSESSQAKDENTKKEKQTITISRGATVDTPINKAEMMVDALYNDQKQNVIFSPMSLNMALGMLNNASIGKTQLKIDDYLGTTKYNKIAQYIIENYSLPEEEVVNPMDSSRKSLVNWYTQFGKTDKEANDLADASLNLLSGYPVDEAKSAQLTEFIESLNEDDNQNLYKLFDNIQQYLYDNQDKDVSIFDVANSIWVSDKTEILEPFANAADQYYKATIDCVDVNDSEGSANKINSWVNEKTRELIPKIIDPEIITPDLCAILINTIYFNSNWEREWWTKDGSFTDASGNTKNLEVIRNQADRYYENDYATAFGIDYKNGFEFIGILPKEDGDFGLNSLDLYSLLIQDKTNEYDIINAEMPRIKFETDNNIIKDTFTNYFNLGIIFDPESAEFPGLVKTQDGQSVYVSDIIQKCTIDLDEYGTEASAATAIVMDFNGAAPMVQPKNIVDVVLDRPFAFIILDRKTNQMAFVGKVVTAD